MAISERMYAEILAHLDAGAELGFITDAKRVELQTWFCENVVRGWGPEFAQDVDDEYRRIVDARGREDLGPVH